MNQKLGQKRRRQDLAKADLLVLTYDPSKARNLTPETRYTFAVLANIFHEMTVLHKLVQASEPRKDATEQVAAAQISQTLMLVRVLAGKVVEARLRINDKVIHRCLRDEFFPLLAPAAEDWKQISRRIEGTRWLTELRNKHAFHYPAFEEIGARVAARWQIDGGGSVFGKTQGNTFYLEADQAMMLALFEVGDSDAATKATSAELVKNFGPLLSELYGLSTAITSLLLALLDHFTEKRLWDEKDPTALPPTVGVRFSDLYIPFFHAGGGGNDKLNVTGPAPP